MRRIISIVMATALCTVAFAQDLDSLRKAQGWDDAPITIKEFMTFCPTPPMGWNSWNKFGCDVSEKLLMETADAMVASGLKDAGYEYIVVDDCWQVSRDADGNIVCDPERFPHGMKYVADYIHSLGLKFGIYISPWDRNDPHYGTPEYNDVYVRTLESALDGCYGSVFEEWFDGACGEGPNGKRQVYDWDRFHETVLKYQPENLCGVH